MRTPYSFSVLRYIHDPLTQEFVNIGVALYSPQAGFLRAICTTHYGRITQTFTKIDGNRFRQLSRYIQDQLNSIGEELRGELPFDRAGRLSNWWDEFYRQMTVPFSFQVRPGSGLRMISKRH